MREGQTFKIQAGGTGARNTGGRDKRSKYKRDLDLENCLPSRRSKYRREDRRLKCRNILCFPIQDEQKVIGVAELCNKTDGPAFSRFDEELATAFSIYCGLSLLHSLLYKRVNDMQMRSKMSNELIMYHMQVPVEEYESLAQAPQPDVPPSFALFSFTPKVIPESLSPRFVVYMLEDLDLLAPHRIPKETVARFVLMVKKGYRDHPYHNWKHAFAVTHFCYLLLKNLQLRQKGILSSLDCLTMMTACLCHDIDHRGTTNSFQVASNSALASLYSSEGSVMERHHFAQTIAILNSEGCNIFETLDGGKYEAAINLLRDLILATDLVNHIGILPQQREMAVRGFVRTDKRHRQLLLCLFMTCCDFSDQTKDWLSSKRTAELIYQEFFRQGDLEKAMGKRPSEMMDRETACIPRLQIEFIDEFALPVFTVLSQLFPEASPPLANLRKNRHCWE
ncbi:unnamed protein product, partial [Cyprideis torosa]